MGIESIFNQIRTDTLFSQGIEQALALDGCETTHAASTTTSGSEVKRQGRPELPAPTQRLDGVKLEQAREEISESLDLMSALFLLARLAREMGVTQRDMENKQVIDSQKAQVAEMRNGATLLNISTVVTAVIGVVSGIMGAVNLSQGAKNIKQQLGHESKIAGREALVDAKVDSLNKQGQQVDRTEVGKIWKQDQLADGAKVKALDKLFARNSEKWQIFNTVTQSVGQMSNSAVQVAQGESQATAKEDEVKATISQTQKQKIEDDMAFNDRFMKDLLEIMRAFSQTANQTLKAAAGVV